jgi:hypothetical protein
LPHHRCLTRRAASDFLAAPPLDICGARNPKKKFQMKIDDNSKPKTWDSPWSTIRQKKMASGVAAKNVADFIAASSNRLVFKVVRLSCDKGN